MSSPFKHPRAIRAETGDGTLPCRIGRAAALSGVSAANIRFYESQGLLPRAVRQDNDYRLFGLAEVQRLRLLRVCRSLGMSLDEMRALVQGGSTPSDPTCATACEVVDGHLQHVRERLSELRVLEQGLERLRQRCSARGDACQVMQGLKEQAEALEEEPPQCKPRPECSSPHTSPVCRR